jgi:hypothetical protein
VRSATLLHQGNEWIPLFIFCWCLTAAHGKWSGTMEYLWCKHHVEAASERLAAILHSISAQDGRREPGRLADAGFQFSVPEGDPACIDSTDRARILINYATRPYACMLVACIQLASEDMKLD